MTRCYTTSRDLPPASRACLARSVRKDRQVPRVPLEQLESQEPTAVRAPRVTPGPRVHRARLALAAVPPDPIAVQAPSRVSQAS